MSQNATINCACIEYGVVAAAGAWAANGLLPRARRMRWRATAPGALGAQSGGSGFLCRSCFCRCVRVLPRGASAAGDLAWFGFALMQVFAVEEWLRRDLREMLYERHSYEQRRVLQEPLTVLIIVGAAGAAARIMSFVMTSVKGRRNVALITALGCSGGVIVLAAFRVISLHFIDDLLYGPLKLNWCLDLGLSLSDDRGPARLRRKLNRDPACW